ncbi:MAG TPA: YIP1 family protein [Candidatus Binataceae bacterium]|nr:YIP1 family protein [Candidatus Binataceae bacterium]
MASGNWIDSPYLQICIRPRATIRAIVDRNPRERVIFLVVLTAFIGALPSLFYNPMPVSLPAGDDTLQLISPEAIHAMNIIMVVSFPVLAIPIWYLNGSFVKWLGTLVGGTATAVEVRAALAWSKVPGIVLEVLGLPFVVFQTPPAMSSDPQQMTAFLHHSMLWFAAGMPLILWNLYVFLSCVAEVHRFSIWRAAGACAIGMLVVIGTLVAGGFIIMLMSLAMFR